MLNCLAGLDGMATLASAYLVLRLVRQVLLFVGLLVALRATTGRTRSDIFSAFTAGAWMPLRRSSSPIDTLRRVRQ